MKDIDSIISSLDLIFSIQSDIIEAYNTLLDISKEVKDERELYLSQLPYHINIIDELHINENAHSRILVKLLQFKNSDGRYEILESFIDFIKRRSTSLEFDKITIKSPVITQEKERIDLWVRDYVTKFAIIFENKIYDAGDQEAQLYRYIEKTRRYKFKDKNIFILYLTKYGDEPSDQTWGSEKAQFQNRYLALSFRDDILAWLKNKVFPNIRKEDSYLSGAVSQYVDYLEGLFNLREINKSLNMNIQKIISEKLGLNSITNLRERYETIQDKLDDINTLQNSLIGIKEQLYQEIIQSWKSEYVLPSSKFQLFEYKDWDEEILFGVKFICDDKPTHVVIGRVGKKFFCQVERDISIRNEVLNKETLSIYTLATSYLKEKSDKYIYQFYGDNIFEVYNIFCELVKAIDKMI